MLEDQKEKNIPTMLGVVLHFTMSSFAASGLKFVSDSIGEAREVARRKFGLDFGLGLPLDRTVCGSFIKMTL